MAIKTIIILIGLTITIGNYIGNVFDIGSSPQYKLLIYPTINDSIEVIKNDTSWLNEELCINLKIDTIRSYDVIEFKKKEDKFFYNNNIYWNSQLYDFKDLKYLLNLRIVNFSVSAAVRLEPQTVASSSCCLDSVQKKYIKNYYKTFRARYSSDEKMKLFIDNIKVSKKQDSKIVENINFNSLVFTIN